MASNGFDSRDASLIVSAKPSGTTATTVGSNVIDLTAIDAIGVRSEPFEFEVAIPAFTATELPADATLTIKLQSCAAADFSANVTDHVSTSIGDGTAYAGGKIAFRPTLKSDEFWRVAVTTTLANSGAVADTAQAKEIVLSYVC